MGSCRCSCCLVLGWDHVDVVVFFWPAMGSVPDDYKCPLCGRVGNGGYCLDGVGFPICTEGDFSCLWFQIQHHGFQPEQIIGNAIQKIFWFKTHLPPNTWEVVASFTGPGCRSSKIPTTPPFPTEEEVRDGEMIKCSSCSIWTLRRVGQRCRCCHKVLRAPAQPVVMDHRNIGKVPWPAEWIAASGQDSSIAASGQDSSSSSSSASSQDSS